MSATENTRPKTRFAAFLRSADFSMAKLARRADVDLDHVRAVKHGRVQPRLDTAERLRRAASDLAGREIELGELFDLDDSKPRGKRA